MAKRKTFERYDEVELAHQGAAFVEAAAKVFDESWATADWTDFVLDWFTQCQSRATKSVWARQSTTPRRWAGRSDLSWLPPRQTTGEWLVDLCHTTYPLGADWEVALKGECSMQLALESEWGKHLNAPYTRKCVLDDAAKLAVVRARAKVMVFGSHNTGEQQKIVAQLQALKDGAADPAHWLWIDVPYKLQQDLASGLLR